jgi:ABC-type antimicrobial peptide transport system permease subunit
LYGVMSYTAARRTNEIGIRLALGATRATVVGMVLRESLLLVLAGIAIGVPLALGASRLISGLLFGVSATDPATISMASLLMIVVAAMAALAPARRAAKVDPMVALRYE